MQYLFLAGRVLYGGFFLLAGIDHFRRVDMMTPYAASKGLPAPRLGVLADVVRCGFERAEKMAFVTRILEAQER